jgi:Nucleotidyltransferase of unknown function (DUF6036)
MAMQTLDLWSLVRRGSQIDPRDLAEAVVNQAAHDELDYRTRLLIRDSVEALKGFWGVKSVERWLAECPLQDKINAICMEEHEKVGFPSIRKRLMDKTEPETIRQYLTQLGYELRSTVKIEVGGGCALILPGYVSRFTEDIDVVGEVPADIRSKYELLDELQKIHGLHMGHVQPHYFPKGWRDRVHSYAVFNHLQISLVDVYDVFLSKLFSARLKDFGDLKIVLPQLDKEVLVRRFLTTCQDFLAAERMKELATKNWHILFGEELPQ